jgi:hypothetical protein
MDNHYNGYTHIIQVKYVAGDTLPVPILDDKGMAGSYIRGPFWCNYTFRVSAAKLSRDNYEAGVLPYLKKFRFGKSLPDGHFIFNVKEIETPLEWRKDFLHDQVNRPWNYMGAYYPDSGFIWTNPVFE